jgi:hypothetical protein
MKVYALGAGVLVLAKLVHVASIATNMPSLFAPADFLAYTTSAVLHTDIFVQLLLAGLLVTSAMLMRDIVKNLILPHSSIVRA